MAEQEGPVEKDLQLINKSSWVRRGAGVANTEALTVADTQRAGEVFCVTELNMNKDKSTRLDTDELIIAA